jgi:peptidoglycan/xylan/chitin deacetylase (PgdA/CDA1 family)
VDLHLMGRATYEEMAEIWLTSDDGYATPVNNIPKVVFPRRLTTVDWPQSTIARGDVADEISALKRESGTDLIAWEAPPSRIRSPGSAWSTSTPWWFSQWPWEAGFRCSPDSPRPFARPHRSPGHTPTVRCSTPTANPSK